MPSSMPSSLWMMVMMPAYDPQLVNMNNKNMPSDPHSYHHPMNVHNSVMHQLETKQSYESLNVLQKTKVLDHLYVEWKDYIGTRDIKKGNKSRPYFKSYFLSKKLSERYPGLGHRVFRLAMNLRLSNEKEKGMLYRRTESDAAVLTKKGQEFNVIEQIAQSDSTKTDQSSGDDTPGDNMRASYDDDVAAAEGDVVDVYYYC